MDKTNYFNLQLVDDNFYNINLNDVLLFNKNHQSITHNRLKNIFDDMSIYWIENRITLYEVQELFVDSVINKYYDRFVRLSNVYYDILQNVLKEYKKVIS